MLGSYQDLFVHAQLPDAPLSISWTAELDSEMDVAELCTYVLDTPGTNAALCLDLFARSH